MVWYSSKNIIIVIQKKAKASRLAKIYIITARKNEVSTYERFRKSLKNFKEDKIPFSLIINN